ncbi:MULTISPECIES: hypothetical protein, partial [Cryobacterium]|uniref:hypothetical protein n=1 Tax=Cryobacterium TaxID=69578 RepID=UPI001A7E06E8
MTGLDAVSGVGWSDHGTASVRASPYEMAVPMGSWLRVRVLVKGRKTSYYPNTGGVFIAGSAISAAVGNPGSGSGGGASGFTARMNVAGSVTNARPLGEVHLRVPASRCFTVHR